MRLSLLIFTLLFISSACTKYQGSDLTEKEHPRLVEASELVQLQDLEGAEAVLLAFSQKEPGFALTHLKLGMLYQETQQPVKALYHFERYLEMRPESEKKNIIEQVIKDERRRLAAAVGPLAGSVSPESPEARILELQQQLSIAKHKQAEAEVHLQQLQLRTGQGNSQPPPEWAQEKLALLEEIRLLRTSAPAERVRESSTSELTAPVARERTYTVKRGDTLSRISQKMYGEASQWRRIYDANREKIPNQNALKLGTVLVIPNE